MKKKIVAGILGLIIIGGAGSYAYANTVSPGNWWSFEEMQPYMDEMHPEFSQEQQQQMFNDCHGENGSYSNGTRGMMQNYNFD